MEDIDIKMEPYYKYIHCWFYFRKHVWRRVNKLWRFDSARIDIEPKWNTYATVFRCENCGSNKVQYDT